jgi:hypothetical protein
MSATVVSLGDRVAKTGDREALLAAVVELHTLITIDPIMGIHPVRVYFVFNPQALAQIVASLDPAERAASRPATAYALVAYDFPFALDQMKVTARQVSPDRAKDLISCSAGLQANTLEAAADALGIEARRIVAFDCGALKNAFFPSTQETVIGLFRLALR